MASTMTPYFGIVVSLIAYGIGTLLFKHSKGFFLFTPLFVAMVLGIVFLKVGNFTFEEYNTGGKMISFFLEPATIAFAIPLYKQVDKLKKYWWQILSAIVVGSICSVVVVFIVAKAIGLDTAVMNSMLPQAQQQQLHYQSLKVSVVFQQLHHLQLFLMLLSYTH